MNLGDKKSQRSVKTTQKCKFRRQKVLKKCERRHKNVTLDDKKSQLVKKKKLQNVNLGDKISQTSVKKTEKYKFR